MHTVPETCAASPGSDEERLNPQHVLSAFLCSTFHSLPPLTDCVFVVWALSVLCLQVQKYGQNFTPDAQFFQLHSFKLPLDAEARSCQ